MPMKNPILVARSLNPNRAPCGMNGLLYYGENIAKARKVFQAAKTGLSNWNEPNPCYGVVLAIYDFERRDFTIKCSKGF